MAWACYYTQRNSQTKKCEYEPTQEDKYVYFYTTWKKKQSLKLWYEVLQYDIHNNDIITNGNFIYIVQQTHQKW